MLIDLLNLVGIPMPPSEPPPADDSAGYKQGVDADAQGAACRTLLARWLEATGGHAPGARLGEAASDAEVDRWAVHLVDSEFERSKAGGWRRLFPSSMSEAYYPFLDPARRLHRLPFRIA